MSTNKKNTCTCLYNTQVVNKLHLCTPLCRKDSISKETFCLSYVYLCVPAFDALLISHTLRE